MLHDYKDLLGKVSPVVKREIVEQTFREIAEEKPYPHSYQTICKEGRDFAVGARMLASSHSAWLKLLRKSGELQSAGEEIYYDGKAIADVFIQSVQQYGETFYPFSTGPFRCAVNQLVLFVKNTEQRFAPYARFHIKQIENQSKLSLEQESKLVDITPIIHCKKIKAVACIDHVETENLPSDFLGNASGTSIYNRAFTGSSSNILMI